MPTCNNVYLLLITFANSFPPDQARLLGLIWIQTVVQSHSVPERVCCKACLFQAQLEDEKEKQRFGEKLLHIDLERMNDETDKRKAQVGRKGKSPRKTHDSVTEEVCYVVDCFVVLATLNRVKFVHSIPRESQKSNVLSYFLTLKFKGSDLCYVYLRPVIDSFHQIYENKLDHMKIQGIITVV